MRRWPAIALFGIIATFGYGMPASASDKSATEPVILATGEWAPYSSEGFLPLYGSYGSAADIVIEAFKRAGFAPLLSFNQFGASYELVRDGAAPSGEVAGFPYYKTEERKKYVHFSEPILNVTDVIFYNRKKAPELGGITDVADLAPYRNLARFVASYCYNDKLENALDYECRTADDSTTNARRQVDVDREINYEIDAFKALLERDDVVLLPATKSVGLRILQTSFAERQWDIKIIPAEELQWSRSIHAIAPRTERGKKLIERFDDALAEMKDTETYRQMRDRAYPVVLTSRLVRLNDPGNIPLIVGQEPDRGDEPPAEDGANVIIPRGTNAIVVRWSRNFLKTEPGEIDLRAELQKKSLVKIVNGPLSGRLLWVKNMYMEIPDAALTINRDPQVEPRDDAPAPPKSVN